MPKKYDLSPNTTSNTPAASSDDVRVDVVPMTTTSSTADLIESSTGSRSIQRDKPYPGMNKEDLLRFSDVPLYNALRSILLVLFVVAWIGLISASIVLVVVTPRCQPAPKMEWWTSGRIYDVVVKSFKDSNSDGLGDLNGVKEKLDYIETINHDVIRLSLVLNQDNVTSNNNGIIDFNSIDPKFGTEAEFKDFINATHSKGMYVIMDFIPNHTSDKHPWFVNSSKSSSSDDFYKNYYVWAVGKNSTVPSAEPPNNWLSFNGESAWTYNTDRSAWYLHHRGAGLPDLNLRNEKVQDEIEKSLKFWLDKGIDGFVLQDVSYLFEDYDLRNNPPSGDTNNQSDYRYLTPKYTRNLPENYDMVRRWRHILNGYGEKDGKAVPKALLIDVTGSANEIKEYYGDCNPNAVGGFPLNKDLLQINQICNGECVRKIIDNFKLTRAKISQWPNWMLGDETVSRLSSRVGADRINIMHILLMTLPGTAMSYYGDEIGMTDLLNETGVTQFIGPMQWNNSSMAGFTKNASSWIPVNNNYQKVNVLDQESIEGSTLNIFKEAAKLKLDKTMEYGLFSYLHTNDDIISYYRWWDGENRYAIALNFGTAFDTFDLTTANSEIPSEAKIVIKSHASMYKDKENADLTKIKLEANQGIVVQWDYKIPELL